MRHEDWFPAYRPSLARFPMFLNLGGIPDALQLVDAILRAERKAEQERW